MDARRDDVAAFLKQQRQDAPGQFAYRDEKCNANIWIGDQVRESLHYSSCCFVAYVCAIHSSLQSALEVRWCADADISAVLFLRPTEEIPLNAAWLRRGDGVEFETLVLETDDEDRGTDSWDKVSDVLSQLLAFMIEKIKVWMSHHKVRCELCV